jgi:predicted metal-binding protein
MVDKGLLEKIFRDHGFDDFKWIDTRDIVVAQWVRFRCLFGCPAYGKIGSCPPNVPSIAECREMISEFSEAAVFHFEKALEKPGDRKPWGKAVITKLLETERSVFLAGYYKAFLAPFDACGFCETCTPSRTECKNPRLARPGADALGIDVYATVRNVGYHIQVLKEYTEAMNRYAFLFIE